MSDLTAPVANVPVRFKLSLYRLTLLYLKTGNVTFGGGDPTLAVLYSEMVTNRRWISPETYALVYTLARITPGTNLLAFCAGTAWELEGWPGAIAAVLAMTVPATLLVLWVTSAYGSISTHPLAMAALAGVLAAAVGMMFTAAWQLAKPAFNRRRWIHAAVAIGSAILLSLVLAISPIQVLGIAALVGLFWKIPE